jgi:hypothetical protein
LNLPDVVQAAVSADGQNQLRLIRRLNSSCSRSIALVVRSDAILGVARLQQINMRKVDGWQTLATASINQPMMSLPNQLGSSGWRFRRANSHHIPGGTSALSCNQLRTMHGG